MDTNNPVLRRAGDGSGWAAVDFDTVTGAGDRSVAVTMPDVLARTAAVFAVAAAAAVTGWVAAPAAPWLLPVGLVAALTLGLVNAFRRVVSPLLVVAYAAAAGTLAGSASFGYSTLAVAADYPGLVGQAVLATGVTFAVALAAYATGLVKVTSRFVKFMTVAVVSYVALAVVSFAAALFGVGGGFGFYGVGPFGILIAAAGVLLASFSLLLDFDAVTRAVAAAAPVREAWRLAFGLLVTLVWLYLELLRFLFLFAADD